MICYLQKPSGWWKAAAFHQPLLSLSPTKNVNYTSKLLGISSRCNESECGLPRTMRSSGNVSDDGKMPSSKTSATPACLPMTCEPHKYGGYPQTRYTGTGHLPHIRPQAVPAWKMFCRELLLPAGSQLDAADAFLLGYQYRHDIAGGELVEDFRSGLDPVHIDLGLST